MYRNTILFRNYFVVLTDEETCTFFETSLLLVYSLLLYTVLLLLTHQNRA